MEGFERVLVYGFSVDLANKQRIVLLKVEDKNRLLPMGIGRPEAAAILMKLQRRVFPRPLTHDLLASVIEGLSASLERVLVTEVRENTVYAVLQLVAGDEEIDVDSRASDAIALAVRTDAPIFVSTELLETLGIEFEQQTEDADEVVKEFQRFLNQVLPEDF